ncbi:hypothetical protein ACYCVF_31235 [Bradyrhizobium sp. 1.29L]
MTDHVTVRDWAEGLNDQGRTASNAARTLLVDLVHNIIGKSQFKHSRQIMAGSQHDVFRSRQSARATATSLHIHDELLRSRASSCGPPLASMALKGFGAI